MASSAAQEAARCFDLNFSVEPSAHGAGRTYVDEQMVRYPLHVGRGLYVDETQRGRCTVSLQSASGGLFGGDHIVGRVLVRSHGDARVQTSAATIVHAMSDGVAEQVTELIAEAHATLAFTPEHLVLFPGSRLCSRTKVVLGEGARVLLHESFLPHTLRSRAGPFAHLDSQVEVVTPCGQLLVKERTRLDGPAWAQRQVGISGAHTVHGTVWLLAPAAQVAAGLGAVRAVLGERACAAGASLLPNEAGLQVRLLSRDAVAFRATLQALTAALDAPAQVRTGAAPAAAVSQPHAWTP